MTELRECDIEDCPYRSPSRIRGKQSGCCGMVRSMLAFGCPVHRPDSGQA
jgi:hypothetical protein